MAPWRPISDDEFSKLFDEQYGELTEKERSMFDKFRVPTWKAVLRRFEKTGAYHVDYPVFVVSQAGEDGVLYFDDIEYGFNIATIDNHGRILTPGGSQNTLKEAVIQWFPEP